MDLLNIHVTTIGGGDAGSYKLAEEATVLQLKQQIASSGGPPVAFQKLMLGSDVLNDDQKIPTLADRTAPTSLSVLLQRPEVKEHFKFEARWAIADGSGNLLEDLRLQATPARSSPAEAKGQGKGEPKGEGKAKGKGKGKDEPNEECQYVPDGGIACVGIEPDSGLLVATWGYDDYHEFFSMDAVSKIIIIPSSDSAYDIPVDANSPLKHAVEIHVMQGEPVYPLPPIDFAVALVENQVIEKNKGKSKGKPKGNSKGKWGDDIANYSHDKTLGLVEFEFCNGYLNVNTSEPSMHFEAVCLDRSVFPPRTLCVVKHPDGKRYVSMMPMRRETGEVTQLFRLSDLLHAADGKRVTSMAWVASKQSVLLTVAGSHAVFVCSISAKSEWQLDFVVGEEKRRGCEDGLLADVRFWFPCSDVYDRDDPQPLISGPDSFIYVYSGGVLMQLDQNLTSAKKVSSMREELWMTEQDEGTPEFPNVSRVVGIHQNKIYRTLQCCTCDHAIHIRRLEASTMLQKARSEIRKVAPGLWPNIDQNNVPDTSGRYDPSSRPVLYNEENRDKWDGNSKWIWDDWLWEGSGVDTDTHVDYVGSTITGIDGTVWGEVIADEGTAWKLASGRIAKKETEGIKWTWAENSACPTSRRDGHIGSTILGMDGSVWGEVIADEGNAWKLASGRIAKKETEGIKWTWGDNSWGGDGEWDQHGWNSSGWHSSGGYDGGGSWSSSGWHSSGGYDGGGGWSSSGGRGRTRQQKR